ncbi:MAG: phosphoribosylglycinamide formyltransferase [Flavobacteriales bacterium]|nr:phosphoribosylglycinamide formyltransferase [Flavobacteriales bacterium]
MRHKLAIFLSGAGSNARNILDFFKGNSETEIVVLLSNRPEAGARAIGNDYGVPVVALTRENFQGDALLKVLADFDVNFIVLAGFLKKIPSELTSAFDRRIVNIHPALLPRFGGKGMYGHYVHEAVVQAGARESGITVHYVNEHYDEGDIIFQARLEVTPDDTPADVERKVRELEITHYPGVLGSLLSQ